MATVLALPEQRVTLKVSWETYERLLAEHVDSPGTRFTYDRGWLEIVVVYVGHEDPNRTLAALVEIIAEETDRDFRRAGSTTFKRKDIEKGFEPDSSFYFDERAAQIREKAELDMLVDPPPDLVIEIDITRSSIPRLPVLEAIGVPEVWRYDGTRVTFYRLMEGGYHEVERSPALPLLTSDQVSIFLADSRREKAPAWLRRIREWVRSQSG